MVRSEDNSGHRRTSYSERRRTERELKLDYFGHIFSEYCRLPKDTRAELLADLPGHLKTLVEQVETTGEVSPDEENQLDWSEIATIEDKILARQDESSLRRKAWAVRSRYARLAGPERYQLYLASRPPDETDPTVPVDALRADLRGVLGLTHFGYSLAVVREDLRRRVMKSVGKLTLWLCGVPLVLGIAAAAMRHTSTSVGASTQPEIWAYIAWRSGLVTTLLAVIVFGSLGAYLSIQRRVQQPTETGDPLMAILGLYEFYNINRFPLISGGLFALVLYLVITSGYLSGELFPELVGGVPAGSTEWARLLIWAFLAGFAERLVPDTLDRLVNQSQSRTPVPVGPPSSSGGGAGGGHTTGGGAGGGTSRAAEGTSSEDRSRNTQTTQTTTATEGTVTTDSKTANSANKEGQGP